MSDAAPERPWRRRPTEFPTGTPRPQPRPANDLFNPLKPARERKPSRALAEELGEGAGSH